MLPRNKVRQQASRGDLVARVRGFGVLSPLMLFFCGASVFFYSRMGLTFSGEGG